MSRKVDFLFIFSAIILFGAISWPIDADPVEDKQALIDFLNNIPHSQPLIWNENSPVCNNWTGVTCNGDNSRVISLQLPGFGFRGSIPPNTLSRLSAIQILSLRSNAISGSFPSDLYKLENLTKLYLQFNQFTGPLPLNFSVWRKNLTVVDISNNGFNGSIPSSISDLTHLTALNLANNSLSGEIPDVNIPSLQQLDLSDNNLTGTLPLSFQRFPSWVFSGNNVSTGNAVPPPLPVRPPDAKPSKTKTKVSQTAILGIALGGCVLGFVLVALMMFMCYSIKNRKDEYPTQSQKKEDSSEEKISDREEKNNRLVFFEGCGLAFNLEDLLRASAEVLGKGSLGTTYKAALEDGSAVVVKRLKEISVSKKEFEQQMEVVGNIRHENVTALRAFYYSKDEKLTVYDYYEPGSVSAMLHGQRGEDRAPLDWESRLRIAIGAARGISHIHTQGGAKLVHGNIKASNIFINSEGYGCISDVGLATIMSPVPTPLIWAAGYRAPEVTDARKAMRASDVYSFGVLLLELLTGKSPVHATGGDEVVHLVRWVNSVVREEWTAEVFDVELSRYPHIQEELVEMLQIGMACVVRVPEQRPKMADVVKMVEEIRQLDTGNPPSSDNNLEI
ncbi:probable inactive receptor kinase At4g23740 [Tripterygium wilfordii]|uniref:probable inactive receptor kinase At4g23740 n=1 Tax=Tripterygium wilfordii TaxID=458696 RepID=UPI0018F82313|nr:probable inactive receptor kinase At4g23740 [Tripterygium wilfordii]